MRLIDAESINYFSDRFFKMNANDGTVRPEQVALKSEIDLIPTVDAKPVVHAHWERTGWNRKNLSIPNEVHYEWKCSHCKRYKIWKKKTQKLPNYCGGCGAQMDEGEKGHE